MTRCSIFLPALLLAAFTAAHAQTNSPPNPAAKAVSKQAAPTGAAPHLAAKAAPKAAPKSDTRKVLVVFGDSLSAGYGVPPGKSYPDDLQRKIDALHYPWRVVNLGISGDTTMGGVARVKYAVQKMPAMVLIELGGNDGLRGLPLSMTRENLDKMIVEFQSAGAHVVLAGMTLPPNYGPDYIQGFQKIYTDLSAKYKLKLIPFLLSDIITPDLRYFQRDGIHPTAEGAEIVSRTVLRTLQPLLASKN